MSTKYKMSVSSCHSAPQYFLLLGVFAYSDYYFRHVFPSAWNKSTPTGRIYMKFYNWVS